MGVMTELRSEYEAVREKGAGLIDLSSRGRIRVGGKEAVMFLNGLITNDMKTLEQNQWMPAAFPNVQGRLIAAVRVVRLSDEDGAIRFLIDTEAETHTQVLKAIERFTMAGDFKVTDISDKTAMFSVQGKDALSIGSKVLGDQIAHLERNGEMETAWSETTLTAMRTSHTAEDGFDVLIDRNDANSLSEAFIAAGVEVIGAETFEILRIEAGIGRFGRDMDETNVITEANLDDAVSFTKGCYIGQEIIARIKYRGHVAKKLTGLEMDNGSPVAAGAVIRTAEAKDIGRITSVTFSPKLNKLVALGYVRYEYLAGGTAVVVGDEQVNARVTELPFVRGSWYQES